MTRKNDRPARDVRPVDCGVPGPRPVAAATPSTAGGTAVRNIQTAAEPLLINAAGLPEIVRRGLRSMLTAFPDRARLARSGEQGDVAIVDLFADRGEASSDLSVMPILALAGDMKARRVALQARRLGAARTVSIHVGIEELVETLETMHRVAQSPGTHAQSPGHPLRSGAGSLTTRETQVLERICRGLSNDEIAADLHLSINSVKTYIRTGYRKIGVTRRAQAVLWAIKHGLGPH